MFEQIARWKTNGVPVNANLSKEEMVEKFVKLVRGEVAVDELALLIGSRRVRRPISKLAKQGYIKEKTGMENGKQTVKILLNEGKTIEELREFMLIDQVRKRRNLNFKEPNISPSISKTVALALEGKKYTEIAEELGISTGLVSNRLNGARNPDAYRKRIFELENRPSLKVLESMVLELEKFGFMEIPKHSQKEYYKMRSSINYLIENLAKDGHHAYISRFDSSIQRGKKSTYSTYDIFGERIDQSFFVVDEHKFRTFLNEVFSERLREKFQARRNSNPAIRGVFTRILHDHGIHSKFCGHDWRKMDTSKENFAHERRED